ncbi:MAG TPA: MFS transporter [Steroidobacteraceae bacterium]|jgi:MFS family permease
MTNASPWRPFHHKVFAIIWTATVLSNVGGWMYATASAWLMTSLSTDPVMVSLVQVAASAPLFLFAFPAGTLADLVDKRRFLIRGEIFIAVASTVLAYLVWRNLISPVSLLLLTFLIESGSAATAPPWQSVVPELVPREDLPPAIAMNSVGVNISRAVGPALGGLLTAGFGIAAPFWINAVSNYGSISALRWWGRQQAGATEGGRAARASGRGPGGIGAAAVGPHPRSSRLPAEQFISGMRVGLRYARNSIQLRATLGHAVAFFLFASCYWALLPLVAREQLSGSAGLYGALLGVIGASAVLGALALPRLRERYDINHLVAAGSCGTTVSILLLGIAKVAYVAVIASVLAGVSWIVVLSSLNVSAQLSLPAWVRGRGLAIYVTVFNGAMTLGSLIWGQVAAVEGLSMTHFIAAAGMLIGVAATRRFKLDTDAAIDLTPSMHWPVPVVSTPIERNAGPVLVTVEYRVRAQDREAFLSAIQRVGGERVRDGAYTWGVFEDVSESNVFIETFYSECWLEHMRQHERVTNADRVIEEGVKHRLTAPLRVTHYVAPPEGE